MWQNHFDAKSFRLQNYLTDTTVFPACLFYLSEIKQNDFFDMAK